MVVESQVYAHDPGAVHVLWTYATYQPAEVELCLSCRKCHACHVNCTAGHVHSM